MADRKPLVAANWKMHKTVGETEAFLDHFLPAADDLGAVEVVVCPPYTSLSAAVERCRRSTVRVAAQDMHEQEQGAFTGEVSASMLLDLGVQGVILGHSERRQLFGERDGRIALKLRAALARGLEPILCVGETEAERDADEMRVVLNRQLESALGELDGAALRRVVVAYEPVWAIGTGRTASRDQAAEAIAYIRQIVGRVDADAATATRVVYGGSVKPDNASDLLAGEEIDGALVGGASLDPHDFLAICKAAI